MSHGFEQREFLRIRELAVFSGISERKLWELVKDPVNPIPIYRFSAAGRIVRVKKCEFEKWGAGFKVVNADSQIDELVTGLLAGRDKEEVRGK